MRAVVDPALARLERPCAVVAADGNSWLSACRLFSLPVGHLPVACHCSRWFSRFQVGQSPAVQTLTLVRSLTHSCKHSFMHNVRQLSTCERASDADAVAVADAVAHRQLAHAQILVHSTARSFVYSFMHCVRMPAVKLHESCCC